MRICKSHTIKDYKDFSDKYQGNHIQWQGPNLPQFYLEIQNDSFYYDEKEPYKKPSTSIHEKDSKHKHHWNGNPVHVMKQ